MAFLNSKGGTIYIGGEDRSGEVKGYHLPRKEQDEFKLLVHHLVEKIVPTVDLMEQEEISVFCVPVTKKGRFTGKHIIKIVVLQGDPSKLYCFSQRLILSNSEKKDKVEEYEIVYAYLRHNMGGIEEVKGMKLIECAEKKASKPNKIADTFHRNCNPVPLSPEIELTKIGFVGLHNKSLLEELKTMFNGYMKKQFTFPFDLTEDIGNQILILELQSKKEFEEVNNYIKKHLTSLNEKMQNIEFVN